MGAIDISLLCLARSPGRFRCYQLLFSLVDVDILSDLISKGIKMRSSQIKRSKGAAPVSHNIHLNYRLFLSMLISNEIGYRFAVHGIFVPIDFLVSIKNGTCRSFINSLLNSL